MRCRVRHRDDIGFAWHGRAKSSRIEELLDEALALSPSERVEPAAEPTATLGGEPDVDAEAAWAAELEHGAHRALAGETCDEDWETVRARIEAALRRG